MLNSDPVRFALIGAGGIARGVHLPALHALGAAPCAVCDLRADRARAAADAYAIPNAYENYLTMLERERPEAVFVLVQPEQSFRIALDCMRAGAHVFIEKPAGITSYQARTLEREARAAGRICQVGFNRRHIPLVRHVVERMRSLTPINQIEGCFFKHGEAAFYDGCASAFMCDTIHAIDCVRWIAGSRALSAATLTMHTDGPVDNAWNSLIRFESGATGVIKANYNTGGRVHSFEIHGPAASAYIDIGFGGQSASARILHFGGQGTHSISAAGPGRVELETLDGIELAGSSEYYAYYGYMAEDAEFLRCVRTGESPLCDISEAVHSMELVELLLNSTF